ncbi:MAG: TIGR04255 family protein [Gammaproteobacteria bacterium]|nr:TIGR04255 family protein [Gammaproteobacteria bacterium]
MPDDLNQKGRFEPIHEAHSIEQVLFVLQFERPIDDVNFAEALKIAEQFQNELPGRAEIQGFELAIGAPVIVGPIPLGPSIGSVFRRIGPDGTVQNELRLQRTSMTFRTSLYTRWDAVWTQTLKYFSDIIIKYAAQTRMSGISLNYVDKFAWVGGVTECRPNLLLRQGSSYLCPHVYAAKDLWHSHTGSFLRVDDKIKRLLNINVDYLDEHPPTGSRRVVTITTVMSDLINQLGYAATEIPTNNVVEFVDAHMRQLHDFGKEVFGQIINDEMCKRIALKDKK